MHSNFLGSYDNSKNGVKSLLDNPFYGVTLTPDLTPNLKLFLLLKKSSFYSKSGGHMGSCPSLELNNSKNGFIFTPYMGCFYSFWS